MKKFIKYVPKAGLWCVTKIDESGKKKIQKQEWFTKEEEAKKEMENK